MGFADLGVMADLGSVAWAEVSSLAFRFHQGFSVWGALGFRLECVGLESLGFNVTGLG